MKFHKLGEVTWEVTYKNKKFIGTWEKLEEEILKWS